CARGVPAAAVAREQPPRQRRHVTVGPGLDPADEPAVGVDAVPETGAGRALVGAAAEHTAEPVVRRRLGLSEPPHDLLVVALDRRSEVLVGPGPEGDDTLRQRLRVLLGVSHPPTITTGPT